MRFLKTDLKKIAFCGGRIHFTLRFVGSFIVIFNLYSVLVYDCLNTSLKENLNTFKMNKD